MTGCALAARSHVQQRDEGVLEARRDRLDARALQRRRRGARLGHQSNVGALDQRIDHARRAERGFLQRALAGAFAVREKTAPAHRCAERRGLAFFERLAFVQQQHAVAAFGLVQVGGREQHAHALAFHQPVHDLPQLAPRHRVDADGRLVQQQQLRRAHQRAGEAQLLLHPARQAPRQARSERRKAGHLHQLRVAPGALGARHALQVGVQVEVLPHAQVLVQAEALRHVAQTRLHLERLLRGVEPQHADAPLVGREQSGGEPHQRGLAGAVRADQSHHLAALHAQAHAAQRVQLALAGAKRLRHPGKLEHRLRGAHSSTARAALMRRCGRGRARGRLRPLRAGPARSKRWRAFPGAARRPARRRTPAPGTRAWCAPRASRPTSG